MHDVKRIASIALCLMVGSLLGCQTMETIPPGTDFQLGFHGVRTRKVVETFREQRFRHTVPQRLDYSCGAAALATLLSFFYGDEVDEEQIIVEMLRAGDVDRIRREGFSVLDMKQYAERRGYETRAFRIKPSVLERLAIPAITLVNTNGYSHFVVIKGTRDQMVYLADPALGERRMGKADFMKGWQGVVFFVAAKRDESAPSGLERLQVTRPAPVDVAHRLESLGLRNLTFDRHEF
jgi:predicted double-glycine peptidase